VTVPEVGNDTDTVAKSPTDDANGVYCCPQTFAPRSGVG
jgi:hypothetical protein